LCIRYKGRRLLSLNIAEADMIFCASYVKSIANPSDLRNSSDLPEAISIGINDIISGTTPKPLIHPLFVQAHRAPCLGYTFAAIYRNWLTIIVSNSLTAAWKEADYNPRLVDGTRSISVCSVIIAPASHSLDIDYKLVHDDDDIKSLRPLSGMLKAALGVDKVRDIESALMASVQRYK
jgi:hypothetical protein